MVTIDGDSITAGYADEEIEPDEDIAALIDRINEELQPLLDQVLAKTSVFLNGERAPGNRTEETNLGNLCTDAFIYITGADVALTNGGGIRASIEPGDITYGDLNTVYPFANIVVTLDIEGADLLAALEHGTSAAPEASGGFPQVSGISFELHLAEDEGSRVKNVMVGDEPLDPEKTYSLATNDFTAIGGDGYDMFGKYPITAEFGALDEALVEYISEALGGIIGEEYADVEGRITIIDIPSEWAWEEVNAAIEAGLVPGTMMWRYSEATTRAQFAELAVILYELVTGEEIEYEEGAFPDTNSVIANKVFAIGVVDGINGLFAGSEPLTRQQAATMLARLANALDCPLPLEEMDFVDSASVAPWAEEAVGQVQAAGIMTGMGGGVFAPSESYQRQQSIATVLRLFEYIAPLEGAADDAGDEEAEAADAEGEEAEDEEAEDVEDEEAEDEELEAAA